jgi:superoxide reductase
MTTKGEIYRCLVCDNMVEVLQEGEGKLVCCQVPMELLKETQTGIGPEKHLPILEKTENGLKVRVGEEEHPMEDNHCIMWMELITDQGTFRHTFRPQESPEAEFPVDPEGVDQVYARIYCSIHGLWRS